MNNSTNKKEHKKYVYQLLQWLQEFGIQCKVEKCQLGVSEVSVQLFGFTFFVVGMELHQIATIADLLTPKSVTNNQGQFTFPNSYPRIIGNYIKVILPLIKLPKKTAATPGSWNGAHPGKLEWTVEAK